MIAALNLYVYRAILRSVYDGDTVTLDIDLGFHNWMLGRKVRLSGYDAPEMRGAEREAGTVIRDVLRDICPVGGEIIFESEADKPDKYGRLLGRLNLPDGRVANDVIAEMLRVGKTQERNDT